MGEVEKEIDCESESRRDPERHWEITMFCVVYHATARELLLFRLRRLPQDARTCGTLPCLI